MDENEDGGRAVVEEGITAARASREGRPPARSAIGELEELYGDAPCGRESSDRQRRQARSDDHDGEIGGDRIERVAGDVRPRGVGEEGVDA